MEILNILSIVEISQGVLLGGLIWTNKIKGSRANIYLGAYLVMLGLSIINDVLYEYDFRMESGTIWQLPTNFLFFFPVMLYLYTTEISGYKRVKPGLKWFIPGILEFVVFSVLLVASLMGYFIDDNSDGYVIFEALYLLIAVCFMLYFLIRIIRHIRKVEKQAEHSFSDLRGKTLKWVRISCSLIVVSFFVFILALFFTDESSETALDYFDSAINIVTMLWIASFGYRQTVVLSLQDGEERKGNFKALSLESEDNEGDRELFDKLRKAIEQDKLYKRQELTLKELASEVSLHEKQLSFLINRYAEKNFYNFINSYRVQEAQNLLVDDDYEHLSFLGIAFEAGFNSKATFNAVFKKLTGLTPRQYRDTQKAA